MKWLSVPPAAGNMIRTRCGEIYHFGVFVSDSEVIEFGAPPAARRGLPDRDVRVISASLSEFSMGGSVEVAEFSPAEKALHPTPDRAIAAARARIGEGGYNLIYNNCEHFANECVTGKRSSTQGDPLRAYFRSFPILHVYTAKIPDDEPIKPVGHSARQDEIDRCRSPRAAREKYFAWRLLEYGLFRSLGKRISDVNPIRGENGKWQTEGVEISISHSDGAAAVAISRTPVGVDLEKIGNTSAERHADKLLSDSELSRYTNADPDERSEIFLEYWCKKESIFKAHGGDILRPKTIDTDAHPTVCKKISIGDEDYMLAIASDSPERLKLYEKIDLSSL